MDQRTSSNGYVFTKACSNTWVDLFYMPAKPISNMEKCMLYVVHIGYLYMFQINMGKGSTPDGLPKGVISRLQYRFFSFSMLLVGLGGTSSRMRVILVLGVTKTYLSKFRLILKSRISRGDK
jgi:hypothetical protein